MIFKQTYLLSQGRISRRQFWLAQLYLMIASFLLLAAAAFLLSKFLANTLLIGLVWLPWTLCASWIVFVTYIKRWHDLNKSGWWLLIAATALIGPVWLLIECGFFRGTAGKNYFGSDPLEPPIGATSRPVSTQPTGLNPQDQSAKVSLTQKPTFHRPLGIALVSNAGLFLLAFIPKLLQAIVLFVGGISGRVQAESAFQTGRLIGLAVGTIIAYAIFIGILLLGLRLLRHKPAQ